MFLGTGAYVCEYRPAHSISGKTQNIDTTLVHRLQLHYTLNNQIPPTGVIK